MSKPFDPNQVISGLIRVNLAFHHINKTAEARFGLSLVQYHLLSRLRAMPGCTLQSLAEAAGMHPSTLTQTLKRLQRKACVQIAGDPHDSRRKMVAMTREGMSHLLRFEEGMGGELNSTLRQISDCLRPV